MRDRVPSRPLDGAGDPGGSVPGVGRRRFWGWGYEDAGLSRAEDVALAERLRPMIKLSSRPIEPPTPSEIVLAPSRLEPPAALAPWCARDDVARAGHTYGKSFRDVVRALDRRWDRPPDVVAVPPNEAGVVAVLDWAAAIDAVVIPYGGGSSVVGGVEAPAGTERPVISLDLGRLDRVLEVDRVSRAALIEGGVYGPSLEEQLRPHDLTLRHYPQSFEVSSLGGWIATRSAGHFATLHTHIDEFVESIRAITPAGLWESRRLPASGAGPAPDRLLIGSEGTLGVITAAWLRLQARPRFRASAVATFATFDDGARAVRAIAQSGLWPANCRLLDAGEALVSGAGSGDDHLVLIGFESADHPVDGPLARAIELARDYGGLVAPRERGPAGPVASWRRAFVRAPYVRDSLVRYGLLCETFETAVTWDRFDDVVSGLRATTEAALRDVGAWPGLITCRLTHAYPDGAAPYFSVLAPGRAGDQLAQWDAVNEALSLAIAALGATTTHHHAVGRDHRVGYDLERPPLFADQLRAAKRVVDPTAMLNPGVLIDP